MGMKCSNSTFNVQGSKIIIVAIDVGGVKIYVRLMETLRKRKKGVKT